MENLIKEPLSLFSNTEKKNITLITQVNKKRYLTLKTNFFTLDLNKKTTNESLVVFAFKYKCIELKFIQ
jgi:hypothetical protein